MAENMAGAIGLDIKIPENAAEREGTKAGSAIQRSLQRSLQAGPNAFKDMFSGLAKGSRQSAQGVGTISSEMSVLEARLENTNALLDVQKQRLARLKEQYDLLPEVGMGGSDRGLKTQRQMLNIESEIISLTQRSDKAAQALWKLDDAMGQTGDVSEKTAVIVEK